MSVKLSFFGAAECVTGSCFLIETETSNFLVDCGMFQGPKTLKELNYRPFPFNPGKIDVVLLTHAHIDHSGLIPKLMLAGFEGPIFATVETIDLCHVLLPDAGAIQEMEVEAINRRRQRNDESIVSAIFTARDAQNALALFRSVAWRDMKQVAPGVRARWWPAGHILGAASIEVEIADSKGVLRLLFSGDLGPGGRDTIDDPEAPTGVDHVILESTYGDRERPQTSSAERRKLLADEVRLAHAAGGPLVIPAFAVERTQELIVDLLDLLDENLVPPAPIFLDSPLAIKACEVFLRRGRTRDGEKPFEALRESRFLHFTESVGESRNLARVRGWHIIIAASGMCDAGRIRHHLKRLLWRPEATVLMVGYQAVGTLGRFLLEGSRRVRIQGEQIAVRARIREIDVYSGHANAQGLVRWAKGCEPIRGKIFLTHGEPPSLKGLAQRLEGAGFQQDAIVVAGLDRAYQLTHSTAEAQASDIRLPEGAVSSLDWHNARSALLLSLDKRLRDAGSDKERREVLESLLQTLKGSAP